jgi:hypothetical protein
MAQILSFPADFSDDTFFMDIARARFYARTNETRPIHELPTTEIRAIIQDAQELKALDYTGFTAFIETALDSIMMERNLEELYDPFQFSRPCWDQEDAMEQARRLR